MLIRKKEREEKKERGREREKGGNTALYVDIRRRQKTTFVLVQRSSQKAKRRNLEESQNVTDKSAEMFRLTRALALLLASLYSK